MSTRVDKKVLRAFFIAVAWRHMNPYFSSRCPGCREPLTRDHHFRRRLLFALALAIGLVAPTITRAEEGAVIITYAAAEEKSDHEWIEIQNISDAPVDLTGWKFFEDDTNHKLTAARGDAILEPDERAVIADVAENYLADHPDFEGALFDSAWTSISESGEEIALKDASGVVVTTFWTEVVKAPDSTPVTPTSTTPVVVENTLPPALITYKMPAPRMIINEVYPNPSTTGEDEWIELYNAGIGTADLLGWTVSDGVSTYTFGFDALAPGAFKVLPRVATNIAFQNSGKETIELRDASGALVDRINYDRDETRGLAFARSDGKMWEWTARPTRGSENNIVIPNRPPVVAVGYPRALPVGTVAAFDATDTFDPDQDTVSFAWIIEDQAFGQGPSLEYTFVEPGRTTVLVRAIDSHGAVAEKELTVIVKEKTAKKKKPQQIVVATAEKLPPPKPTKTPASKRKNSSTKNTQAVRTGIVTAPPGLINKRTFIIEDAAAGALEIYQHNGKFPELAVGDAVRVVGRISPSNDRRIIIAAPESVVHIEMDNAIEPAKVTVEDISDELARRLVKISGELVDSTKKGFTLDDGTGEIFIAASSHPNVKEGTRVEITGILLVLPSGNTLMTRGADDINVISTPVATTNDEPPKPRRPLPHPIVPVAATGLGLLGAHLIIRRLRPATRSPP